MTSEPWSAVPPSSLSPHARAIQEGIEGHPVVDTHDHLHPMADLRGEIGLMGLMRRTYLARSLRRPDSSLNGLSRSFMNEMGDDTWNGFAGVSAKVKYGAYFRYLMRSLSQLYDVPEELSPETWDTLDAALRRRYEEDDWLERVLRRAGIVAVVWDPAWRVGEWRVPLKLFYPSVRVNSSIFAFHPDSFDREGGNIIRDWAAEFDCDITSLSALEDLIDRVLSANLTHGLRALKFAHAYDRPIAVGPPNRDRATAVFGKHPDRTTIEDRLAFSDHIIRFFLDFARQHNLVIQAHTGMARLAWSEPLGLESLFGEFSDLTFDLVHCGYPWVHEAGALAHNFPNVRLNLSWLPLLSPSMAANALMEWIQVVPQEGRISWGADCSTVEEAFGALLALRDVLGVALGMLVDYGYFGVRDAIAVAGGILASSGARTYRLDVDGLA